MIFGEQAGPRAVMWQNWPMSREPAPADAVIASVRQWIAEARSVVALTGAGISTDSGIPDFRGPQGEIGRAHV